MGNKDDGHAELAQQGTQLNLHRLAQLAIERGQGLIQQQEVRTDGQRAGYGDTLLLAAGKLRDRAGGEWSKLNHGQQFGHAGGDGRSLLAACAQPKGDVLLDRKVREQRVVLEHDADITPVRRQPGQVPPAEEHLATVGGKQPGQYAQQRRLATAGGAEQRDKLALAHGEGDILKHTGLPEAFGDTLNPQMAGTRFGHGPHLAQPMT